MVAEAVQEQEEVTTPASTPEAPESIPEPTTQAETEGGIDLDAIVSALDESATETKGGTASSEGITDNPLKDLTPEQIEERGAQRERERIASASQATERQRQLEGLNNALPTIKSRVKDTLSDAGLPTETVLSVLGMFDELHGTHIGLRRFDLDQYRPQLEQEAGTRTQATVANLIYDTVKEDLGDASVKALQSAGAQNWGEFVKAVGKEYRKGYVPAADYTSKKSVKELLGKYDTALKERGLSLADITGNGGTDLPPPRGGNARSGTVEWATEAPISELLADRARRAAG